MGSKYFIFLYIVSQNRYKINTTALIDTEVNGFAFISTTYITNTVKFLNIKAIQLKKLILVKGYNG